MLHCRVDWGWRPVGRLVAERVDDPFGHRTTPSGTGRPAVVEGAVQFCCCLRAAHACSSPLEASLVTVPVTAPPMRPCVNTTFSSGCAAHSGGTPRLLWHASCWCGMPPGCIGSVWVGESAPQATWIAAHDVNHTQAVRKSAQAARKTRQLGSRREKELFLRRTSYFCA